MGQKKSESISFRVTSELLEQLQDLRGPLNARSTHEAAALLVEWALPHIQAARKRRDRKALRG